MLRLPPRLSLNIDLTLCVNAPLASFQNVKLTSSFNWHIKLENWAPLQRATTNSVETWDRRGTIPGADFKAMSVFWASSSIPKKKEPRDHTFHNSIFDGCRTQIVGPDLACGFCSEASQFCCSISCQSQTFRWESFVDDLFNWLHVCVVQTCFIGVI